MSIARLVAAALLFACSSATETTPPPPADCRTPGACNLVACSVPQKQGTHVEVCSFIPFDSNPPTSGPHYGQWASFKSYDKPVPRGFYLHSIEHGGILLAYNCQLYQQGDCAALVAQLTTFVASRGDDPKCAGHAARNRFVVTPDPLLDAPFAAAAWGHHLKGDCFDAAVVAAFTDAHYARSYEDLCNDGVDPTDPASGFPADCGAASPAP
jgi:hypothetical protein